MFILLVTTEMLLLLHPGRGFSLLLQVFKTSPWTDFKPRLVQRIAGVNHSEKLHVFHFRELLLANRNIVGFELMYSTFSEMTSWSPEAVQRVSDCQVWACVQRPECGTGSDPERQHCKALTRSLTQEPSKICLSAYVKCKESGFQSQSSFQ